MGFAVGSGPRFRPDINVTPLVDVVLVLLIIFMVVTPLAMKQFRVRVPEPVEGPPPDEDAAPAVVVTIRQDGRVSLNREVLETDAFVQRLRGLYATRTERVTFIAVDDDVAYGRVVEVMDLARSGGADPLVVIPDPLSDAAMP